MLSKETKEELYDKLQRCYVASNRMLLKMYNLYFPIENSKEDGEFKVGHPLLKSEIRYTDIIYDAEDIKGDIDEYMSK